MLGLTRSRRPFLLRGGRGGGGEGFGHISPEFSPKFFTKNFDPPKNKLMASLNRPKRKELGAVKKVTSTSSKKEVGGRRGRGGKVGGEDAGRVEGLGERNPEGNSTRLELVIDGLDEGKNKCRAHNNVRELLRPLIAELAFFAVRNRVRKPSPSRPSICKGPNYQAREVRGHACAQGLKEGLYESKRQRILEILKGPSASPGVEKDRKRRGVHNFVKNAKGFLLWLSWLVFEGPNEFNVKRII